MQAESILTYLERLRNTGSHKLDLSKYDSYRYFLYGTVTSKQIYPNQNLSLSFNIIKIEIVPVETRSAQDNRSAGYPAG
jgi:hypothetical protein